MKPKRIEPGWRLTVAQKVLHVLFGRPWHFISAWPRAGVSAVVIPVCNGRVLLGQRAGHIEHVGCWSCIGGFVDTQDQETYPAAARREFWEETGLKLTEDALPSYPDLTILSFNQPKNEEVAVNVSVGYFITGAEESLVNKATLQPETSAFGWFTEEQIAEMIADGRIPADFTDMHEALRETFRRLKEGYVPRPLKLA